MIEEWSTYQIRLESLKCVMPEKLVADAGEITLPLKRLISESAASWNVQSTQS